MHAWACKGEGGSKKAEKLRAYLMYGPQRESGFMGLYSEQNYSHHVKEHEQLCSKMVSEVMCIFV